MALGGRLQRLMWISRELELPADKSANSSDAIVFWIYCRRRELCGQRSSGWVVKLCAQSSSSKCVSTIESACASIEVDWR